MKLFKSENYFDAFSGKWVEHYWINGREVDADMYFSEQDNEVQTEYRKLDKMIEDELSYMDNYEEKCDCSECECLNVCDKATIEVSFEKYIDMTIEDILDCDCDECIKDCLLRFADVIANLIEDGFLKLEEYEDDFSECYDFGYEKGIKN